MKRAVFIQTNDKQLLGAKISAHSYKRNSKRPDSFDVHIMRAEEFPRLMQEGQSILRAGHIRDWDPDDLQSFTPTRFAPPKLMGYEGRAVVTDPDCFGVGDVADLFDRDMGGKAVMAVARPGHNKRNDYVATSVMLLDCAKLTNWDPDKDLDDLFAKRFDYIDWIELKRQPAETVGLLESEWNSFDRLTPDTKILHTTKRRTQPWKTGLPVDYTLRERGPLDFLRRWKRRRYDQHPDRNQEAMVYSLLAEMVDQEIVTRQEIVAAMAANHVRHDSLEAMERYRGWNGLAAA
ncbi:MAG: hypothetical protein ABIS39_01085 [Sphingomicrobium sp.]